MMFKWYLSGTKELVEFLKEEIDAENQVQKQVQIPKQIDGFQVKFDGAEVELTKDLGSEKYIF